MVIRCIIIDDEPLAMAMLKEYCVRIPYLHVIGSFTDAIEAAQILRVERPDLLLLDIQMPDISGLQLARNTGYSPQIIFTTAHSQFAVEGFDLDAADYLLKPYSFERFALAIEKVKKRLTPPIPVIEGPSSSIIIKSGYQNIEIRISDILYIEAMDNYTIVHTLAKRHIAHITLKGLEYQLPSTQFIRVHRSFSINRTKIDSFTKASAQIAGNSIPIGRSYTTSFMDAMRVGS
jgi:DNA-binding LytR/AlgR family response regulator